MLLSVYCFSIALMVWIFAQNSGLMSTISGTNEQRERAINNLLSESPSDSAEETRVQYSPKLTRLKVDTSSWINSRKT